jgi:four helix bundle protein
MRNFKELKIWQKGFEIATKAYKLTGTFPKEEKFGIVFQINKSGVSIPSNVAEGNSRSSEKDKSRFIEISLGSAFEMETQLLISAAVGFGDDSLRSELLSDLNVEQKMLISFINTLNK